MEKKKDEKETYATEDPTKTSAQEQEDMAKEAINRGTEMSLLDAIRMEAELFALCFSHEDVQEGVDAFLNKREPNFS